MDDQRDKLPGSEPAPGDPSDDERNPSSEIPEEAGEVYELVEEEDVVLPSPVSVPGAPAIPEYSTEAMEEIRTLKAKVEHKDRQIEQVMEAYRAKKDETEKLRKRIEKTERRRFEQSKGDFIARFVEVLDNLDRAIDSIEGAFDPDSVLQGIMLVRSRLVQLLKEEGLEKIFVRGQIFDPANSEAAQLEDVEDESQDGVVLKELQPGYMLKGSLLRVARVVVGRHGGPTPGAEPGGGGATERSPAQTAGPPGTSDEDDSDESWESDTAGQELEFSEDGFDFSAD